MRNSIALLVALVSCAAKQPNAAIVSVASPTRQITEQVMDTCEAQGTLRQLKAVAAFAASRADSLPEAERLPFLILICIESRFDQDAVSPVGAVGLTQVMPRYVVEFAKTCSLPSGNIKKAEYNLAVGACQFHLLFEQFKGNIALVLAAYNAGANSATIRKIQRLERINSETSNYIARYTYLYHVISQQLASAGGAGEAQPTGSPIHGEQGPTGP